MSVENYAKSDDYTKKILENIPTSKEQWKFIENKTNSKKQRKKLQRWTRAVT